MKMAAAFALLTFLMSWGGNRLSWGSCGSGACALHANPDFNSGRKIRLEMAYEYMDQNSPYTGAKPSDGLQSTPERYIKNHTHGHQEVRTINKRWNLKTTVDLTERLEMEWQLPLVNRKHDHLDAFFKNGGEFDEVTTSTSPQSWTLSSMGDMSLIMRWAIWPNLRLGLGLKLPTGSTTLASPIVDHGRFKLVAAERSLQPGTGSWDPMVSLSFNQEIEALAVFANAQWKNPIKARDYQFGNEALVSAGSGLSVGQRWEISGQFNYLWKDRDEDDLESIVHENTGGRYLFLTPGIRLKAASNVAGFLYTQLPLYRRVNGSQLTADWTLMMGFFYDL